jgi:gamma-glutamylcyclotransferase
MKYFAYGSNMCTNRLRERVSSAVVDQTAALHNFTLKFHKRSSDGSAKCDAFYTGNDAHKVYGVIFEIDESQKLDLDRWEGRGHGYDQITIQVHTDDGMVEMFTYVADPKAIDDSLEPYSWYKELVLGGAIEHALPLFHVRAIQSVKEKEDLNRERDQKKRKLLPCRNSESQ